MRFPTNNYPDFGFVIAGVFYTDERPPHFFYCNENVSGSELFTRSWTGLRYLLAVEESAPTVELSECIITSPRHFQVLHPAVLPDSTPVFLYLVLDRQMCNFAMALFQAREWAKRLAVTGLAEDKAE